MACLKDNLWTALDALRNSPEDPLDFDQIQEAVDQWKHVRQELEFEDAVSNAVDCVDEAFYYAIYEYGVTDEKQLVSVQNKAMDYVREAVKDVMDPEPVGKHAKGAATKQDKLDRKATVYTYTFSPATGFTKVDDLKDEVPNMIKDLFDSNK